MMTGHSTPPVLRAAFRIGALLLLLSAGVALRASVPTWTLSGNTSVARIHALSFALPDGTVLVVGGLSGGTAADLATDRYNPATGTWSSGPSALFAHPDLPAGVRLADGRILVTGGRYGFDVRRSAEIFDPATNSWSATGEMKGPRAGHTLTQLADGRVLAAGGWNGNFDATAEIYNPVSGQWAYTANMSQGKWFHTATLLPDGRVLVAGGENYSAAGGPHFRNTQYYNPGDGTWSDGPLLNTGRADHEAALLADGRVIVIGGLNGFAANAPLASTEIFNGVSWQPGPAMSKPRFHFPLVVMSDGGLLVSGGTTTNGSPQMATAEAERFDPLGNAWSSSGVMNAPRRFHSAVQLADGRVLVAGGQDGANSLISSEIMSGDAVAPVTAATRSVAPNGNGWNNGSVTITLNATDNAGGSGVQSIVYSLSGAQTGGGTSAGDMASVMISTEGATTLTYHAIDADGNVETDETLVVKIDRTLPMLAPQANITVPATAGGTVVEFSPSASDTLSGIVSISSSPLSSGMRFPAGTTTIQVTALDAAGNAAMGAFNVTVVPSGPVVTVTGGEFVADGNPHAATAIARDRLGAPVAGTFNIMYAPGGASAPSAVGRYSASASFTSNDAGILSATPWTTMTADPNPKSSPAVAVINGKLYAYGFDQGASQSTFVPRLSIYDPATNTWSIGKSPNLIRAFASVGVIGGKLYVAGGCIMSDCRIGITTALEIYDPVNDSWSVGPAMTNGRFGAAAGVVDGRFVVTGGTRDCPPCSISTATEVYDPATLAWISRAAIPVSRELPASAVVNGLLYVIGGYERNPANTFVGAATGRVDVYDPAANTWTTRTSMPAARSGAAAGVINGLIYVAGGAGATPVMTNESYDPLRDSWFSESPMQTARTYTSGAVLNSQLYVIDGFNGITHIGTTERFDPSLTAHITITAPANPFPVANAGGPYIGELNDGITLNGSASHDPDGGAIAGYAWTIGGSLFLSGVNPIVTAAQIDALGVGAHAVSLTVTDALGATGTAQTTLSIYNNVATASFTANPNPAACQQFVSFNGSTSSAGRPDRSIVSYVWNFGDGTPSAPGGSSVGHNYSAFGSYPVTLTVTDNSVPARTATTSLTVVVSLGNQPPFANHGGPYSVDLGNSGQLNGAASSDPNTACGDSIVSYSWTIDGSLVLNGVNPILTAAQIGALGVGPHNVSLSVTDEFGASGTTSTTLSIYNNVPTASFTANPNPVSCNQVVSFNAFGSSAGRPDRQIVNYSWNFGDGSVLVSGMSSSLNHSYGGYGSYTASLTVTDNNVPAKSATTSVVIAVSQGNQPPHANPGGPYSVNQGGSVQLNGANSSDPNAGCGDSIVSYAWTIDGTIQLLGPSPALDTAANSLTAGSHSVSLTVTDEFGASGTSTTTLNVQPVLMSVSVSPSTASLSVGQKQTFQAIGLYSDGTTRMLPSGSGGGNGGGGGGFGPTLPRWSVNFVPSMIDVSACATAQSPAPLNFSSQTLVDMNGSVHETWSPGTPVVTVDGSINATTVALTVVCTTSPVSGTITAQWTGTKYEGTFSFNGGASTGTVTLTGWSQQAPMPAARFSLAAASVDGVVYALGGGNPGVPQPLYAYTAAANSWATVGQMATSREGAGAAAVNGKIYVVGGHVAGGIASGITEAYDPSNNTWDTALAPMPTPRAHLAVMTDGTYIYALGGDTIGSNGGLVTTVERYNPAANTWSALAPMPRAGSFIAAGVLNGKIVVIGAGGNGGPSNATDLYDISTGTWQPGAAMPASRSMMSAGVANGGLYVFGGTIDGSPAYDTWVYYPATATRADYWSGVGSMLTARSQAAAAVVGDVVYAIGGMVPGTNPPTEFATNEALSTPPLNTFAPGGGSVGNGGGAEALPTVQWQSTNPSVAGVDNSGNAHANTVGQTTIVAMLSNGMSCETSNTCASLTVVDTQPPFLSLPNGTTREATGPSGAAVSFFASANDSVDGPRPVTCDPSSGSIFPFGTTTVTCSASDTSGNTATGAFNVTVQDTTAPFMGVPNNQTREAMNANGAVVTYTATANDSVDGARPVSCNPSSGSQFPFGPTLVTCSASDTRGNTATRTFTITVQDTTAPFMSVPNNQTREATNANGAVVTYTATANDSVDGARPVSCNPSSGSQFPFGPTLVTCSASDTRGNTATRTFTITVRDSTAPAIASAAPSRASLWPPNHSMVPITVAVSVSDIADAAPVCSIASVGSSETANGQGDGDTAPDWVVTGPLSVDLRAERAGNGSGRVYTIGVTCADRAGNTATAEAQVTVTHDGKK